MTTFLYPGFNFKAVTFSYDDGTVWDRRLVSVFKKYGMRATFNLNSGSFGKKGELLNHGGFRVNFDRIGADEVESLYSGMEVAMHTVNHPDLPNLDDNEFDFEVLSDRDTLEALCKKRPTGLAYPCGRYDERTVSRLKSLGVRYARTVRDTHGFSLPEDFLIWDPTCHDHDAKIGELITEFLETDFNEMSLFYIWGHSFELNKTDCDRWAAMEEICRRLGNKNDIWYADNGEICDYVTAARKKSGETGEVNDTGTELYLLKDGEKIVWKNGETFG